LLYAHDRIRESCKTAHKKSLCHGARDAYTGSHLWRVSQYCRILVEYGGLPRNVVARISLAGYLHDLGKISVPDAILNKKDVLTAEEYAIIKTHLEVGSRLRVRPSSGRTRR
jgi:HD-GYP domain-containing protein (c-di-GMP phosphodiesterase class II)